MVVGLNNDYLRPIAEQVIRDVTIGKAADNVRVLIFFMNDENTDCPIPNNSTKIKSLAGKLVDRTMVLLRIQRITNIADLHKVDTTWFSDTDPLAVTLVNRLKNQAEVAQYLRATSNA